jgi:hypothetical protein
MEQVFVKSYGEGAYGIVYRNAAGEYEVYEVPLYGGVERLEQTFPADQLEEAKAFAQSFT